MAYPQSNVIISTSTFYDWISITNQLANAMSVAVVTANSTGGLDSVTGNAQINGNLFVNTAVVGTLSGGNTSTNLPIVINSPINFGANITQQYANSVVLSSNTANQTIDTFSTSTWRSAKYLVQISDGSNYQVTELLALQDHINSNVVSTEYATLLTNNQVATFSVNYANNFVYLSTNPMTASNTFVIEFTRTSLTV